MKALRFDDIDAALRATNMMQGLLCMARHRKKLFDTPMETLPPGELADAIRKKAVETAALYAKMRGTDAGSRKAAPSKTESVNICDGCAFAIGCQKYQWFGTLSNCQRRAEILPESWPAGPWYCKDCEKYKEGSACYVCGRSEYADPRCYKPRNPQEIRIEQPAPASRCESCTRLPYCKDMGRYCLKPCDSYTTEPLGWPEKIYCKACLGKFVMSNEFCSTLAAGDEPADPRCYVHAPAPEPEGGLVLTATSLWSNSITEGGYLA